MRKQNRVALWAGRARAAADLPQRQRRRPHPRRDGLALLGAAVRLPHVRPGARGRPEVPRLIAVARRELRRLRAARRDGALRRDDEGPPRSRSPGPPVIAAAIGEELTADELGGPEGRPASRAATRTSSSTTRRRRSRPSGACSPTCPTRPTTRRRRRRPRRPAARRRAAARRSCRATRAAATTCARCSRRSSTPAHRSPWGERYGASVLCSFARLEGEAVGVVASQPMQRARRPGRAGADEGGRVRRPLRHVQPAARLPPGRARA